MSSILQRVLRPRLTQVTRTACTRTCPIAIAATSARTMSHKPEILRTETFETPAKWLKLERIMYRDQEGKERFWEVANRKTRSTAGVDSCHMLAIVHLSTGPSVILIEQYRPPVGAVVVELPAGLMDANEDAATTAVRELREETGYAEDVTVRSVSPVLVKDPGMSGANMHLVTLDVRPPTDAPPTPQLEVGEHIVTRLVPLKDIQAVLDDYAKRGFAIDALLQSIVTGLALAA